MGQWSKLHWVGKKTGKNPTDRAKLGCKRSLLTEAKGLPLGLVIAGANHNDKTLLQATLDSIPSELSTDRLIEEIWNLCLDAGYDYADIPPMLESRDYTPHIRSAKEKQQLQQSQRPNPEHPQQPNPLEPQPYPYLDYQPRRWVVERSASWLNRFRRLLIRWEKKADNHLALLHFACAIICLKATGLFG